MKSSHIREPELTSLLYVSRSTLAVDGDVEEVARIVDIAVARNRTLSVTGALLYTQLHFAQVLEGPAQAIDDLMISIRRDSRQCDLRVLMEKRVKTRRFASWAMAYAGPIPYLDRQLKPLLSPVTDETVRLALAEVLVSNLQRLHTEERAST